MKTKRNKGIFAAVCVILCYILLSTANVSAAEITLLNKGEEVSLAYPIIRENEELYIAIEDLKEINLAYNGSKDSEMYIFKQYGERYDAYTLSITDNYFKGDSKIYENVTILKEKVRYIKLSAIAEVFSEKYTVDDGMIEIWINNYLTQNFNVTVNLDVPVHEEGFTITLFSGLYDPTYSPGGISYGSGGYTSYQGTRIDIPDATDMTGIKKLYLKNMQTVTKTIPCGENSVIVSFDVERTQYQDKYDTYIGYYVDNKYYWDNGYRMFDFSYKGNHNISFTTSCVEKKYITGSVTVPEHDEALSYTIVAEANRTLNYYDNGSYDAGRSHTFKTTGTLAENETAQNYSLAVLGDKDYYVYIVFSNGEYIRQSVAIDNLTEDTNIDFSSFSASNKLSGSIKLPEDFECSEPSTVMARVFLQSAKAPYYYLDEKYVQIDVQTKSGDFALTDDMGTENVIVYFYFNDTTGKELGGIYREGVYKNNDKCVANVKHATAISPDSSNIILNAIKTKTVTVTQRVSGCDLNSGTSGVYLLLQKSSNASEADAKEIELIWDGRDFLQESDTVQIQTYTFIVPEDYSYYVMKQNHLSSGSVIYKTESGNMTDSLTNARVYSVDDVPVNVSYSGYEPDIPFEVYIGNYWGEEGLDFTVYNKYDKIYLNNAKCYFAIYDSNERLSKVLVENISVGLNGAGITTFVLSESDYNTAEKIRLFIFDETLRPLAMETAVK